MTQEPEFNTSHPEYVPFSNAYIGHVMTGRNCCCDCGNCLLAVINTFFGTKG